MLNFIKCFSKGLKLAVLRLAVLGLAVLRLAVLRLAVLRPHRFIILVKYYTGGFFWRVKYYIRKISTAVPPGFGGTFDFFGGVGDLYSINHCDWQSIWRESFARLYLKNNILKLANISNATKKLYIIPKDFQTIHKNFGNT